MLIYLFRIIYITLFNFDNLTEKIEYFRLIEEKKKINIDEMLRLSEIGSSIDRYTIS